jgi:hypothetical protein
VLARTFRLGELLAADARLVINALGVPVDKVADAPHWAVVSFVLDLEINAFQPIANDRDHLRSPLTSSRAKKLSHEAPAH